jgi:hypothetical protein
MLLDSFRRLLMWVKTMNADGVLRLVSPRFFFSCFFAYFSGVKIGGIRPLVPANAGAIVERQWVDERGNPSSYKITTWVGQPPPGA